MGPFYSLPFEEFILGTYIQASGSRWAGLIEWTVRVDRGGRSVVGAEQPDPGCLGIVPREWRRAHRLISEALVQIPMLRRTVPHWEREGVRLLAWAGGDLWSGGQQLYLFDTFGRLGTLVYTCRLHHGVSVASWEVPLLEYRDIRTNEPLASVPLELGYPCAWIPKQAQKVPNDRRGSRPSRWEQS